MGILLYVVYFLIALLILVTIHEFGHYYVAKRCGVKVLRFSVGFGRPLFSWKDKSGTLYTLAMIPLGGYVKMLDEREGEVDAEELSQAFTRKSVFARIAIVAAGPIANFILAILLFWGLTLGGTTEISPIIGHVEKGSVAEQLGLEKGQTIIAIDGEPTRDWQAVQQNLLNRLGESGMMHFSVRYPGSELVYQSEVELVDWLRGVEEPDPIEGLGIRFYRPEVTLEIGVVAPGTPAEKAGIQVGDKILAADGQPMELWQPWAAYVMARAEQSVDLLVLRQGQEINLTVVPELVTLDDGRKVGRVGVAGVSPEWPEGAIVHRQYGVFESFGVAVERTWSTAGFVLLSVKKLIVGEISTKNLSGPITIAKVAGDSAERGLKSYIGFMALISIFLGVFNLLPIPVLDGGHLLYYLIELVKGSPVPEKVQLVGFQLGLLMVACLTVVALYNDITRLL